MAAEKFIMLKVTSEAKIIILAKTMFLSNKRIFFVRKKHLQMTNKKHEEILPKLRLDYSESFFPLGILSATCILIFGK